MSCGSEEKEEVVVVEVESNLPVSYFKDSLIEREQVVANLRILELDRILFDLNGMDTRKTCLTITFPITLST